MLSSDIKYSQNTYGGPLFFLEIPGVRRVCGSRCCIWGGGHFLQPFSLQPSTKEGWCNPEIGNKYQGSSIFSRSYAHIIIRAEANIKGYIDSLLSVSNTESCDKYAWWVGLSTESSNSRLEIGPSENLDTHTFFVSSYSSSSRENSKLECKGIWIDHASF